MPCFRPLKGYRAAARNPTGKRSIVFNYREANSVDPHDQVSLPCGQCTFCRLEHSRGWAIRATHEASLYPLNCFLTLTYSDEHLPKLGGYPNLDYDAPVFFMKRLRDRYGEGIRSFGCAEYGEKLSRPHYHICLFNFDFPDKTLWKKTDENRLFTSPSLQGLWPYGHSTIGDLTFESAAYVARYVTKKITGNRAQSHYEAIDQSTGEVFEKLPERSISVSRMPGLGRPWYEKFYDFVLNHDYVISRGHKVRPPKYYDRLSEKLFPERFALVKKRRQESGEMANENLIKQDHDAILAYRRLHQLDDHQYVYKPKRIEILEHCQENKLSLLKRGLELG